MAENKELYVVDASVVLKWFLAESQDKSQALQLKNDYTEGKIEINMPTSCLYEILNTIGRILPAQATIILSEILMLNIEQNDLSLKISFLALSIMEKFPKISFYDSAYHASAIHHNGTFITADEKYYQKTKELKHIKLLKDYK